MFGDGPITLQIKNKIMQKADAKCSSVFLDSHRKSQQNLLDYGTQAGLVNHAYFEIYFLPLLRPAKGEKSEAHNVYDLTEMNDGGVLSTHYIKLDVTF